MRHNRPFKREQRRRCRHHRCYRRMHVRATSCIDNPNTHQACGAAPTGGAACYTDKGGARSVVCAPEVQPCGGHCLRPTAHHIPWWPTAHHRCCSQTASSESVHGLVETAAFVAAYCDASGNSPRRVVAQVNMRVQRARKRNCKVRVEGPRTIKAAHAD